MTRKQWERDYRAARLIRGFERETGVYLFSLDGSVPSSAFGAASRHASGQVLSNDRLADDPNARLYRRQVKRLQARVSA